MKKILLISSFCFLVAGAAFAQFDKLKNIARSLTAGEW
jgi:hypothetical protein